ncbi:MAG TPA: hypothetical protein VMH83_04820 [Candidatus Acidoferrum sp.]|nr:hypothetical protein [Candidatus Acidoferrum sp.]
MSGFLAIPLRFVPPCWLYACLLLAGSMAHAATIRVCPQDSVADENSEMYGTDGRPVQVTLSDAMTTDARCQAVTLPVADSNIRWFSLTELKPSAAPPTLGLQGYFRDQGTEISEITGAPTLPPEADFLPLASNLLPSLQAGAFGAEARSRVQDTTLACEQGKQAAGLYLRTALRWEQLPRMQLELVLRGTGEFGVAIADGERERREAPLLLGDVRLQGNDARSVRFELPASAQPWSSVTLLCPATAAHAQLESVRLLPAAPETVSSRRGAWLWSPQWWQQRALDVWPLAAREHLHKLYMTLPVNADGSLEQVAQLATFVQQAREHQLEVWAVLGDRHDVLPQSLALLLRRVQAYLQYNAEHKTAQLAGVQLDIEPYLLPGYVLAPDYWRQRYLATVNGVQTTLAQQLPLDLVVPVWWGTHPDWGSQLLDGLRQSGLSLTVMNYRTNTEALRAGALPFLAWGQQSGNKVTMALERGTLGVNAGNGRNESYRRYAADLKSGELWLFDIGGTGLLVLFDGVQAGLPGLAYRRTGETVVDVRNITFAGDEETLRALATRLETEWSVWESFAGLAIHGLDQLPTQGR